MQPEQIARKFSAYCNMAGELADDPGFDKEAWAEAYFDSFIKGQGVQRHSPWELTWTREMPRTVRRWYPWHKEILIWIANRFGFHPEQYDTYINWACRGTTLATEIGKETDGSE